MLLALAYLENIRRNEIYILINNPTFNGKVVDSRTIQHGGGLPLTRHIEHQLHIVGEYIYEDETVKVDRFFRVSRYLYNRFEIGDTIYWHGN